MHFPTARAEELLEIEDRLYTLGDGLEPHADEPFRPGWKTRSERKQHMINKTRQERDNQPRTTLVTDHVRQLLSRDAVSEKGGRPAYVVVAERSLDQLMDTIHTMGELTVAQVE